MPVNLFVTWVCGNFSIFVVATKEQPQEGRVETVNCHRVCVVAICTIK